MHSEWTQTTTVQKGGRVEVVVPILEEGRQVKVIVKSEDSHRPGGRTFGSARGKGSMTPDFEDPIEDLGDYS